MTKQDWSDLDDYISKRLHLSWLRLQESSDYQEQQRAVKQREAIAEAIMRQKLDQQERRFVLAYLEEESEASYLEQIEAYLQGLRDCASLLAYLGLFHAEPVRQRAF